MRNPKKYLVDSVVAYRQQRRNYLANWKAPISSNNVTKDCDSFRKGTEFESFIVQRFNPDYFTLIEWRSDKTVDNIYPVMSAFPDLEFYYKSNTEEKFFAVECKWREYFVNGKIELNKYLLDNYRSYQAVLGYPTFIVIGIGNVPSHPNQVYVVPLKDIKNEILHEFSLNVFQRKNPFENFFLNCSNDSLM